MIKALATLSIISTVHAPFDLKLFSENGNGFGREVTPSIFKGVEISGDHRLIEIPKERLKNLPLSA